jgi:UDP-GlcNAc:undecaprenyl-phosphate/decaprenyl-phosphate GlcNAc-1-phosphate transferase
MELLFSNNNLIIIESFIFAFIITYISVPSIVEVAILKKLYDVPNGRTSHEKVTPTLGGMAIFLGFVISSMIFVNISQIVYVQYILASMIVIFFLGLKDDIVGLSPMKKFVGQIIAAGIVIDLGGIKLESLYGVAGIHSLDYYSSDLFSLFVIIAIVNALNLIDGIDGLASGVGIIASVAFGTWFYLNGDIQLAILSTALIGSLGAFFIFNVFATKNKLFMGDIGSLMLGFMLSVFAIKFIELNRISTSIYAISSAPALAIGILIIPIFDTIRVFGIRIVKGESPFKADKRHVHHYLLELTGSHKKSTCILLIVNLLFIALAFFLREIRITLLVIILFAFAGMLSFLPYRMAQNRRKKQACKKDPKKGFMKFFAGGGRAS